MYRRRSRHWCRIVCRALCISFVLMVLGSCATLPVPVGKPGVAVWDIEDMSRTSPGDSVGELLALQVMEALKGKGEYVVLERTKLTRVLEELHLGSSALATEQSRLDLGKIIGVRLMVFGGYQLFSGQMRIDLRLVDVESGRIVKAVHRLASGESLDAWLSAAREAGGAL